VKDHYRFHGWNDTSERKAVTMKLQIGTDILQRNTKLDLLFITGCIENPASMQLP